MYRYAAFTALAVLGLASVAHGQVIVARPVVTTYYAPAVTPVVTPAPAVSYYAPTVSLAPTVSYRAPVTTYYAPATVSYAAPVTTYYAPAPVTTYYAPTTTYYAPAVVAPVVTTPVVAGRTAYGTVRAYVPGQPVRNTLRYLTP